MAELVSSQEKERHSLQVLFCADPSRAGDPVGRSQAPPKPSVSATDIYSLLPQNKNTSFKYFELYRGCCGKLEVAVASFASFFFFKLDFPSSELIIHIFSLRTSSPWYLMINNSCSDVTGDSTPEQGIIFPFYQELSYLFLFIHRLVTQKDILVEYIPLHVRL